MLPRGYAVEEHDWRRRHQVPLRLLALHVPLLRWSEACSVAASSRWSPPSSCRSSARLGHLLSHHRRAAAVSVTLGLVWCSAALVGITGGAIESHFHFFIIIGFIALYQDWVPFLF